MTAEPRLYVLLAREARMGVVFRRGPSKHVLLLSWNLDTDAFSPGQWLHGRVYEEICDLSPNGDLLLYFAANQRPPYSTWTAISRPPYLTALALWPNGQTRGGGGLFESPTSVVIDQDLNENGLADGFTVPPWLHVAPFRRRGSWTHDDSVWGARHLRDGWRLTSEPGKLTERTYDAGPVRWEPPQVWEKAHPLAPERYRLRMTHSLFPEGRPWYVADYEVLDGPAAESLGKIAWADWDRTGDLLFARDGALYRLRQSSGVLPPLEHAHRIAADFSAMRFDRRKSPEEARFWPLR